MPNVWVTENWYIPVDEQGYVEGPCFEGMLGCVLQLRSGNEDVLAMKFPRLLADTIEENSYICNMTEEEEEAVRKINTAGGNVEGLVAAQFFESNRLIKRRSTIQSNYSDARAQHDHVIFVSFEHDRKPRFCAVNFTGGVWSIFPEECHEDFVRDVSEEDWDYFIEMAGGKPHLIFSQAVFRSHELKKRADRGEMRGALQGRQFKVWYAAIPSMIFQWAGGNLQETITKGEIGKWSFDKHFILFEQVLKGVRYLHSHGMIHGDIRPANVMWVSSQEPGNFRLGDYGSYGKEWQAVGRPGAPGGHTLIGPAVGQRRQSPFYAPERRTGNEFESADTAIVKRIITDEKTKAYYYVLLLGWRSQLLKAGLVQPEVSDLMKTWGIDAAKKEQERREAEEKYRRQSEEERLQLTSEDLKRAKERRPQVDVQRHTKEQPPDPDSDELYRGDRLRLRNYLFEVISSEKKDDNRKLFLCSGRYSDILHGSLVVYKESGFINDWTVIDLSNYVEFRQWSAASDLYSIGALFLYSLFCCGLQKHTKSNQAIDPDRLFVEMIEILESVPYFRFFWEELETFRQHVEELYRRDPQPTPKQAADTQVLAPKQATDTQILEGQTLFDMALYATNNILQSTPKARVVLEAFDYNLAHFLLFMHFVLACLHRKSHMTSETSVRVAEETDFIAPFADDRLEPPESNGAASRALERLQIIEQYLDQQFFREFKCKDTDKEKRILDFDPRSDFQIRIEHENLKMKIRSKWLIPKPAAIISGLRKKLRPPIKEQSTS